MPKMLDPFTGHEAKGDMIDEYTVLFQKQGYRHFGKLIEDFNEIITKPSFKVNLERCLCELEEQKDYKDIEKLRKALQDEFKPIEIQA